MTVPEKESTVGIFWLVGKRLIVDTTPLSQAGNYGEFKIHDGDHITFWSAMEERGEVPRNSDYEEHLAGASITTRELSSSLFFWTPAFSAKSVW
jgi:hypothetical protein